VAFFENLIMEWGMSIQTESRFLRHIVVLWVAIFIFYNYLASHEEKLLEAKFGESYRSYQEKTGKWLPRMPFIHKDKDAVF
jgi:protein-S-isoprenylcysteine O-methyltransferase Ste14